MGWGQAVAEAFGLGKIFAKYYYSEEGYGEDKKRKELERAREKAKRALLDHDLVALRAATDELDRLSNAP